MSGTRMIGSVLLVTWLRLGGAFAEEPTEGVVATAAPATVANVALIADLSGGTLKTVGNIKVDDAGVRQGPQTFVKEAGKRLWKLGAGDAMVVSFSAPPQMRAIAVQIDEVGWLEADLAKTLCVAINGNEPLELPAAPAKTLKTHHVEIPAGALREGGNRISLANNGTGTIGIQTVLVVCSGTGEAVPSQAAKPQPAAAPAEGPVADETALVLSDEDRKHGRTELHKAAQAGDVSAIRKLLEAGADKAAVTDRKWTALHYAADGGRTEAVCCLLEAGLPVDQRTSAMGGGWATALYLAAKGGYVATAQALIDRGANVDPAAMQSWTPLHIAASRGQQEMVACLLAAGANANALTDLGDPALHLAAAEGHAAVVKTLVEVGKVDKCAVNAEGFTALHLAAQNGKFETAKYLLDIGVPINGLNHSGRTATDLSNPEFAKQWRSVRDTSGHKKVYDHLQSRGGKHGWELKAKKKTK
ncbi:MAG: ankyrin repeat domain-containing protein [Armatimonadetes bacterium]|nr:ankyrin repeat domain-containing protein [Armatimonadota bacterium]NCO93520.1 ankyrin repeat domain-containing protein [Armatimonadota bacterium]NCP31442.1 ankyrin repeat domain-containing protein [Armatimonadota bacterium]NDK14292.1 ankyrin repeat domain-containing protein [Armatimonadota bacterium]